MGRCREGLTSFAGSTGNRGRGFLTQEHPPTRCRKRKPRRARAGLIECMRISAEKRANAEHNSEETRVLQGEAVSRVRGYFGDGALLLHRLRR